MIESFFIHQRSFNNVLVVNSISIYKDLSIDLIFYLPYPLIDTKNSLGVRSNNIVPNPNRQTMFTNTNRQPAHYIVLSLFYTST